MRKFVVMFLALVLCVLIVAGGIYWIVGRGGESRIEAWIGSQIKQIVNGRINPVLTFDSLDYQSPDVVIVTNLRVVADGGRLDIFSAERATIRLAEIPREGKPIVIQEIRLQRPVIRLIANENEPTRFVGFSNFVRNASTIDPKMTDESGRKLSDVLRIRFIEIVGGEIEYDPKITGTQPMILQDIETKLIVTPDAAGLYHITADLARAPIFSLSADGKIDLDKARLVETKVKLSAMVNTDTLSSLPPQLQKIINDHEIRGALTIDAIGGFPLSDPSAGWFQSDVSLNDAFVSFGDWCVPVSSANVKLRMNEGIVHINDGEVTAFDGLTRIAGQMKLNPQLDLKLSIDARKIKLAKLMSSRAATQPTSLRGVVDAQIELDAPAKIVAAKIMDDNRRETTALPSEWGSGQIELREGRLVRIPFVSRFNAAIMKLASYVRLDSEAKPGSSDSASIRFTLSHDQLRFSQLDYSGDVIAARGTGTIGLDQSLNLRFNAGPIEKLQSKLGVVGDLFGKITDNLGSYRVTGTMDDPQVSVALLH